MPRQWPNSFQTHIITLFFVLGQSGAISPMGIFHHLPLPSPARSTCIASTTTSEQSSNSYRIAGISLFVHPYPGTSCLALNSYSRLLYSLPFVLSYRNNPLSTFYTCTSSTIRRIGCRTSTYICKIRLSTFYNRTCTCLECGCRSGGWVTI